MLHTYSLYHQVVYTTATSPPCSAKPHTQCRHLSFLTQSCIMYVLTQLLHVSLLLDTILQPNNQQPWCAKKSDKQSIDLYWPVQALMCLMKVSDLTFFGLCSMSYTSTSCQYRHTQAVTGCWWCCCLSVGHTTSHVMTVLSWLCVVFSPQNNLQELHISTHPE